MEQRLSVITICVENLAQSREFYTELGWQPAGDTEKDGVVFFQLNGVVFSLYPHKSFEKEIGQNLNKGNGSVVLAYNGRTKEEVDSVLAKAKAAGGKILKKAADTFWGGYSGHFTDPDNNIWEVAHNPFWKIDGDGNISVKGE